MNPKIEIINSTLLKEFDLVTPTEVDGWMRLLHSYNALTEGCRKTWREKFNGIDVDAKHDNGVPLTRFSAQVAPRDGTEMYGDLLLLAHRYDGTEGRWLGQSVKLYGVAIDRLARQCPAINNADLLLQITNYLCTKSAFENNPDKALLSEFARTVFDSFD